MPIAIAIGAGLATFLLYLGIVGNRAGEKQRRAELLARVRGDLPEGQHGGSRRRGFRLFRRRRPQLALRGPRRGFLAQLGPTLTRAGISAQPGEFLVIAALATALPGFVGFSLVGSLGMPAGLALGAVAVAFVVKRKTSKRRSQINSQLNDLLQVVAGGLTAGQSFLQSLSSAAREIGDPLGGELRILLNEVELGGTLEEAFERLRERIGDEDMDLVIDAVLIQRRVGGNLSEVLNNISWTIRERIRIRGEIKALTGQARMSGWVLGLLPVALAVILSFMNAEYMSPLFDTTLGHALLAMGVGSEVVGFVIMRKISNIAV